MYYKKNKTRSPTKYLIKITLLSVPQVDNFISIFQPLTTWLLYENIFFGITVTIKWFINIKIFYLQNISLTYIYTVS